MNTTNQMRDDLAGARESITSGELFTGDDLAVRDGANSRRENEMELDEFEGHTPGPLACVELMAFAAGFAVEDGEGRTVARIMKTHGVERLPSRANAALFAAAPELLAEVRRLTAEAAELRRERDELAARLEAIEQAEPVAWIEHELQGTGLRHLHFERRPNTLRDEVVDPVWTELIARPVPAPGATPGSAEEFATSDDPRRRDGSAACIDCMMRGDCLMSSAQRSAAAKPCRCAEAVGEQMRQPLTREQRDLVAEHAAAEMELDANLSWRNAIITEVERAHGIGVD